MRSRDWTGLWLSIAQATIEAGGVGIRDVNGEYCRHISGLTNDRKAVCREAGDRSQSRLLPRFKLSCKGIGLTIVGATLCVAPILSASRLYAQINDGSLDDLLQVLMRFEETSSFRVIIAEVTAESPLIAQRLASGAEAEAVRREARSANFPTIDLAVSANRALAREFSNDPECDQTFAMPGTC